MNRNLILANLVLGTCVVWGGLKLHRDWVQFKAGHAVASLQAGPGPVTGTALKTGAAAAVSPAFWADIAARNIFSFDRSDIPAVAAVVPARGAAQPKPFLFGTMSVGGPLMAMVGPGRAGNRAYRSMVVGEVIDGWTVLQIGDKSMVVESGGERQTLLMNDPSAQLPRDYSRTAAAGQNAALPAAKPPVSEAGKPSPPPPPAAAAAPAVPGAEPAAGRTQIIHTPFGDKVVPVP